VSLPRTTWDEVALPLAGALRLAAVPASVTALSVCVCEAAAAPMSAGAMASDCPVACVLACAVGALEFVSLLSFVATAPIDAGVIGSDPADAWELACDAGGPPPSAAIDPSVTLEVTEPSELSEGTTESNVAEAEGRAEMVVSGISTSP
jgi:hypothetical protein